MVERVCYRARKTVVGKRMLCELLAPTGPSLALCKGQVWPAHAREKQKIRQKPSVALHCLYPAVPTCSSVPREDRSVLLCFAQEKERGEF